MRPLLVVFVQPLVGNRLRFLDGCEEPPVEAIVAKDRVEALDERILPRTPGIDVPSLDILLRRPLPKSLRYQLRPVVRTNAERSTVQRHQRFQNSDHVTGGQRAAPSARE